MALCAVADYLSCQALRVPRAQEFKLNLRPLLLLLPMLAACGQPPSPVPETPLVHAPLQVPVPAASLPPVVAPVTPPIPQLPLPLDERLTAEIGRGGSVLLDLRDDSVLAKSLDGTRTERLMATDATWLWPDAQTRVLWLWRESAGELQALDMAAPLPVAVTVATGVPAGLAWQWPKRAMVGPEDARVRLSLDPHDFGFQHVMPPDPGHWNAPRRWKACRTKTKLADAVCPVLAPGADALLHVWVSRQGSPASATRLGHAGPQPPGCSAATCGVAHALGNTHWWLVPATVWSDCCRRGHQLYDPRTRRFLRLGSGKMLPKPSGDRRDTVETLWLCPQGDAIVTESGVVPLEPPGALRFGDADACLGGQPLRTPSLPCPQGDQCEDEPPVGAPDDVPPL